MSNCCPEFYPVKVSQLGKYSNVDLNDLLLVIESGSANYSRRSTIANLVNAFRLHPSGSYSGSFSGSFNGKVLSKNANLTGALSGSYQGSIVSKNTIASGSFSGSYYGKVLSKNIKATGSFRGTSVGIFYGLASGSLQGSLISKNAKATGSFSGSLYGNILSKNTIASGSFSGSIFGKILSKNIKATGSLSGSLYGKSTFSNTSSYLKQETNQSYKFTYFDGKGLVNSPYFSYIPAASIYDNYYISSSNPANYLIIDSKAGGGGFAESGLVLSNNYKRNTRVPSYNWGPEGWRFLVSASGSLYLSSLTGSNQFQNQNFTPKGVNAYFNLLRTVNNVLYLWPEQFSYQTLTRDSSVGIGVQAPTLATSVQNTSGKLHIRVFSSSVAGRGTGAWPGSGTVRNLPAAIYVDYGSSSYQRTFFVSGSGNMYSAGTLTVANGISASLSGSTFGRIISKNAKASGSFSGSIFGRVVSKNTRASGSLSGSYFGSLRSKNSLLTGSFRGIDNITNFKGTGKKVSVNATASYAITSSFALSVALSATSVNRKTIEVQAYGYPTAIPTIVAHGCPITTPPYGFIANWVAKSGNPLASAGSIFNFDDVWYRSINDDVDQYTAGAAIKVDSTNVSIGWPYNWNFNNTPGGAILIPDTSPTQFKTFTATDWNLRITLFY